MPLFGIFQKIFPGQNMTNTPRPDEIRKPGAGNPMRSHRPAWQGGRSPERSVLAPSTRTEQAGPTTGRIPNCHVKHSAQGACENTIALRTAERRGVGRRLLTRWRRVILQFLRFFEKTRVTKTGGKTLLGGPGAKFWPGPR